MFRVPRRTAARMLAVSTLVLGAGLAELTATAEAAHVSGTGDGATAAADDTTLVSRASGAGDSHSAAISVDGRFVAFTSDGDDLSDQDNNAYSNVYVRDLQIGTTTYVSRGDGVAGAAAHGDSLDG